MKVPWEKEKGVRYSKLGIVEFIEKTLKEEDPNGKDKKNAKLWEKKLEHSGLKYYMKKGGSNLNKNQPYFRTEMTFNRLFEIPKLAKCIYDVHE